MRSDAVKTGTQQAPHRSLFNALGMTKEEMDRPLVGIVSSYNEIVPGHMNLDKITQAVKLGVAMAGGTPVMFPAIAVCDGIAMGHVGMKYSLVTRDLIAAYEYSRNIQSGCCHQKSGYVLVTVWNHYQCIKLMCHCHCFCGICDQVSGDQRIFHSNVSHCNTVTYCDCREHNRCTACHCHTKLNCLCDLVKVHMTRYDFIVRTYDTSPFPV